MAAMTPPSGEDHLRRKCLGFRSLPGTAVGNLIGFGLVVRINVCGIDRQASAGHQWFGAAARLTVVAVRLVWPGASAADSNGRYRPQNGTECGGEDWMQGGA
jgi:hypothetical protein